MSRPRAREITLQDVRAALAGADLRYCTLRPMAERFGVSPGTLHNRLKVYGTNFERERKAEQRRRFEAAVAGGQIGNGYEYAAACGFWEPVSFYRAFRDWYGVAFPKWRNQQEAAA